eukprot:TRINITY_DN11226_c0_g1_i1.p1 TRINITY_DN11226_c0_g1~~TRINITY_DN11226_c0_g1_i1.p1  ORF type:complete len:440 (-),score=102.59 TRINITY_DN11226_c0_g1_i1:114-1433(-)
MSKSLERLELSGNQLQQLVKDFQKEMEIGLNRVEGERSSLKMLHSFVSKPTGNETGYFYALDLGGTNFRVIRLELKGNGQLGASQLQSFTISEAAMTGGVQDLFNFIADCVEEFVEKHGESSSRNETIKLGFTFSFPVNQTSLASGTLIKWTKGFTTEGVVGKDVVALLNDAFHRKNLKIEVVALVNDTVGTLVARGYSDTKCELGVILGTGTNAAYAEDITKIKSLESSFKSEKMVINIEWGAFGDVYPVLPLTTADDTLDVNSVNPKNQRFEKSISGMYLGEITRLIILEFQQEGKIFSGQNVKDSAFNSGYKFHTSYVSKIIADSSEDLNATESILESNFGLKTSKEERILFKTVAQAVVTRAARLSATTIGAILEKIGRLNDVTVAVDGGVYEHVPGFKQLMEDTIKELYPSSEVRTVLSRDGSGNGAAIIAASA